MKHWEPPAKKDEIVGRKNHFTIERWGRGWAINVHRRGEPLKTILCSTEGEVNRERMRLSGEGLIGYIGGAG